MKTALLAIASAIGTAGLLILVWSLCNAAKDASWFFCGDCRRYWSDDGLMQKTTPLAREIPEKQCRFCACPIKGGNILPQGIEFPSAQKGLPTTRQVKGSSGIAGGHTRGGSFI